MFSHTWIMSSRWSRRCSTDRMWSGALLCFLGAVGVSACVDSTPTQPASTLWEQGPALRSAAGFLVSESRMRELLSHLARDVAVALSDAELRSLVYRSLQESPFPEKKLHFRSYLRGAGVNLLNRIADHRAKLSRAVLASLDSIIDLEFYMPVRAHKEVWRGGPDLIVAANIRDHELPVAFDLTGASVPIQSAREPPATPALVLVPVETDFSNPPAAVAVSPSPAVVTPGHYLVYSAIYNIGQYEGWTAGLPEIEIHTFVETSTGFLADWECAGERRFDDFYFNQDADVFTGNVLLVSAGTVGQRRHQFQVWEDDNNYCTSSGGRPPHTTGPNADEIREWIARLLKIVEKFSSGKLFNQITAVIEAGGLSYDIAVTLNYDDFVGVVQGPI